MAARTQSPKPPADNAPRRDRRMPPTLMQSTGPTHPHIDASPPFWLVFEPTRWVVIDGRLVPALIKIPLEPNVNQVEKLRDGRYNLEALKAKIGAMGRTLIPGEWGPDGEGYCCVVETRPNGQINVVEAWITIWETTNVNTSKVTVDEHGYADWLESLVSSGKLSPCPSYIIEQMLEKAERRLKRLMGSKDGYALRGAVLEAEIAVLKSAAEKARGAKVTGRRTMPTEATPGGV